MKKWLVVALTLLLAAPAWGQGSFPLNNIPMGKGTGKTGWTPIPPGANGDCLVSFGGTWLTDLCPETPPGGTNGQIQYNNAGSFGGFTMSGDCTTDTSTGVTTCRQPFVATRTALKALDTTKITQIILTESGRTGPFVFTTTNCTTAIATDTNEGVYIKANAISAGTACWIRQFDFINFWAKWFGAVANYSTDNTSVIQSMINTSNVQNTLTGSQQQTAVYLNIEGGVKFVSDNLQWLPSANWVFMYLNYFANSDTTKGINTGGGGTNELMRLSVNSGYVADATGGYVAEDRLVAPVNPSTGVNIKKNIDNSVFKHLGTTQTVQPNRLNPARASVNAISDENLGRLRFTYQHYALSDPTNGTLVYVASRTTQLQCTGCNGAGAWGANIPAIGTTVRTTVSGARYVVTSLGTANALETDWLSGEAAPGDTLMSERDIFEANIVGNVMTVTKMLNGTTNLAVGQTIVSMYKNAGVTAATTISSLGTGTGGLGTYNLSGSPQSVATTQLISGFLSANNIGGGGVINTDTETPPIQFSMKRNMIITTTTFANATCSTLEKGALTSISDSNTVVWGANVAGGGANQVLAYCNGTNFTVAGK